MENSHLVITSSAAISPGSECAIWSSTRKLILSKLDPRGDRPGETSIFHTMKYNIRMLKSFFFFFNSKVLKLMMSRGTSEEQRMFWRIKQSPDIFFHKKKNSTDGQVKTSELKQHHLEGLNKWVVKVLQTLYEDRMNSWRWCLWKQRDAAPLMDYG